MISLLIQQLMLLFFNTVRANKTGLLPPRSVLRIKLLFPNLVFRTGLFPPPRDVFRTGLLFPNLVFRTGLLPHMDVFRIGPRGEVPFEVLAKKRSLSYQLFFQK